MDLQKNLLEYGKLSLELQDINTKIYEIFRIYDADEVPVQLFQYFRENKESYFAMSLEQWGYKHNESIHDSSYDLLKLIKQKKRVKQKINYRLRNIREYSIELFIEKEKLNNERIN